MENRGIDMLSLPFEKTDAKKTTKQDDPKSLWASTHAIYIEDVLTTPHLPDHAYLRAQSEINETLR